PVPGYPLESPPPWRRSHKWDVVNRSGGDRVIDTPRVGSGRAAHSSGCPAASFGVGLPGAAAVLVATEQDDIRCDDIAAVALAAILVLPARRLQPSLNENRHALSQELRQRFRALAE